MIGNLLIQDGWRLSQCLGYIDEQHRLGLINVIFCEKGDNPDKPADDSDPIPRLAITAFGMDVSYH